MKLDQRKLDKGMTLSVLAFVFTAMLMYIRAFLGVEIADEAYHIAEAKVTLDGIFPYVYNTSLIGGFSLFSSPLVAAYRLFVPNEEGLVLFTRLCFVTYKLLVSLAIFFLLQKKLKRRYALLLACIILPMHGWTHSFNYNSIPMLNSLLAGVLLYDAVELQAKHKKCEIILSGFLTAVSCWSNPGRGMTWILFLSLLIFRLPKGERNCCLHFLGGSFCVSAMVLSPIIWQTGLEDFGQGIWRIFSPIPSDYIGTFLRGDIIKICGDIFTRWIQIFLIATGIFYLFFLHCVNKNGQNLEKKGCLLLALTTAMAIHAMYICYTIFLAPQSHKHIGVWGGIAFLEMLVFACAGLFKKEKIVYYAGIYPVVYTLITIYYTRIFGIFRFDNWHFLFFVILYALFKYESHLIRMMATVSSIILIVSMILLDMNCYISEPFPRNLTAKVEAGVYKGLYTSQERAKDMTEMEEYLNQIIGENETYAFRDNVPCGYLMVHRGMICDISAWDQMQYHWQGNSPAKLFDYYKRRNMIPDKIIYVYFPLYFTPRRLSIDDPKFRYNDFVNTYYNLVEDIELNETFKRVKVYQYNGRFDGNYQYWIDTYWQPTRPKKNSLF